MERAVIERAVIESGRAEFALNTVKGIVNKENDKTKKEFKSYVRKFPSLILTNGLAAAVAFAVDKGGSYTLIYDIISKWLKDKGFFDNPATLVEYICSLDSDMYRVATNEVLSLFEWLKRFATGMIEGDDS